MGNKGCSPDEEVLKEGNLDIPTQELIASIPVISSLSDEEKKLLANKMKRRSYKKDEIICKEGEEGKEFFIILTGQCEVLLPQEKENPVLSPGDYMGEQSLLNTDSLRNATVKCASDVVVLVASRDLFNSVLKDNTKVKFANRNRKRAAVLGRVGKTANASSKDGSDVKKSDEEIEFILESVKNNLMFMHMDSDQKTKIIKKMYLEKVNSGVKLITQGERDAQTFYVIKKGEFSIQIDGDELVKFKTGNCFGELALMYGAPRAATVQATVDSEVWVVTRDVFRVALRSDAEQKNSKVKAFLRSVDCFSSLLNAEISNLVTALNAKKYKEGTTVVKEGDDGDTFYLVASGKATWSKANGESGEITAGGYFGERALIKNQTRAATIIATTNLRTLELSKQDFTELLGPLDQIMKARMKSEDKRASEFVAVAEKPVTKVVASQDKKQLDKTVCSLKELKTIGVLGKGAFGTVTLVVDGNNNKSYALKAIKKFQIVELGQQEHIVNEKNVMLLLSNPFLVNLRATYKDKYKVYFLLDVCLGGELFSILRKNRCFNEATSRFYTACVVEAFDYMHGINVIYRDLKPENLVLDDRGYLKVTDFGFAKQITGKTYTLCGTPDYLAPEIVIGQGHGKAVDWWTLGILIYEMLASFPPFFDDETLQTYRKIVKGKVKFPRFFSKPSRDIIKGFLKVKPTKRLGIQGMGDVSRIRQHEWFTANEFNWDNLVNFKARPPIRPKVKGIDDIGNFDKIKMDNEKLKAVPPEDDFDETF